MKRERWLFFVLAVSLLLGVSPALAQSWDPATYTALIELGRTLHSEAQTEPEGSAERRDLLVNSLSTNRQAQHMLREAILSGAVDDFRADAIAEHFNLTDNIIVSLMALDQCEAAAAEVERLAQDESLHPPDAAGHIDTLRDNLEGCRQRVATSPAPWDLEAYRAAEARADSWREVADGADSEAERQAALYEATLAEGEALGQLREAALAGRPTPGREPTTGLGAHYNRVIVGLLEMGLCDAAERRITERDESLSSLGVSGARNAYTSQLDDCRTNVASAAMVEAGAETDAGLAPQVEYVESDTNPWPYVLLGAGAASGIAALVVDLALTGDRNDFDEFKTACREGDLIACEQRDVLASSIDRHKIIIGTLAGVALVTGATGLIWLLTSDDSNEEQSSAQVQFSPFGGPDGFGASVRVTH